MRLELWERRLSERETIYPRTELLSREGAEEALLSAAGVCDEDPITEERVDLGEEGVICGGVLELLGRDTMDFTRLPHDLFIGLDVGDKVVRDALLNRTDDDTDLDRFIGFPSSRPSAFEINRSELGVLD